ncbi:MAG: radical SAM protein [Nitrospirae bacterium]|nr:radical SAM protein [Nitrospirota bacterium]
MRVCLVQPNIEASITVKRSYPPLGLGYLATVLKNNNVDVTLLDAQALNMSEQQMEQYFIEQKFDIIGITSTTWQLAGAIKCCQISKKVNSNTLTLMGGVHPTFYPKETLGFNDIDIIVRGEGEITLQELISQIDKKLPLNDINGIAFKHNGEIIITSNRQPIEDLDSIPFPDRNLFKKDYYKCYTTVVRQKPCFSIVSSRGCHFKCNFCSSPDFWQKQRLRSPKNIVDEIEMLVNNLGAKEIMFVVDTFNATLEHAKELCQEIIDRKLKISWRTNARVYPIDEELVKLMKRAGCWLVYYGVENGNPEMMKKIGKAITPEKVIRAFDITEKAGIRTFAYFIIGLPGETEQSIKETIALQKKIHPDFMVYGKPMIFPGTRLYEIAVSQGIASPVADGQYYTVPYYITKEMTEEVMDKYIKSVFKNHYLNPSYIFKRAMRIRSFTELLSTVESALPSIMPSVKNPFDGGRWLRGNIDTKKTSINKTS